MNTTNWSVRIKQIREKLKLSKYAFAKRLGIRWNTVHHWEKGFFAPDLKNQKLLEELERTKK